MASSLSIRAQGAGLAWLAALGLLAGCAAEAEGPAPEPSRAYFPVQRCVNLGNALEAPEEGLWGYRIEEAHLQAVAAAGFDTVRVPINWHDHAGQAAPYSVDEAFFARIDEVIAQSLEAGLNVIIDMHHYDGLYDAPAGHAARAAAIWRQIAARYADYPPELIFEPMNEPQENLSGETWDAIAADLVAAIRETNPTRTLVLGGDNWNSISGLRRFAMPDDPYLVATAHYYSPYDFTHQGADWFDDPPPAGRDWGSEAERAELAADMDAAAEWSAAHSMPVFLGEFGVFEAAPPDARARWTEAMVEAAEARGMGWCVYSLASGFAVRDMEAGHWLPDLAGAMGIGPAAEAELRR